MNTPRLSFALVAVLSIFFTFPGQNDAFGREAPQDSVENISGADFSGVELFLELTALLEKDQEPTQEQWDRLFATPGYAALVKDEFDKGFFINRFTLAFMPSKKAELDDRLKKDTGFWAQFLPHYLKAKSSRAQIRDYVAKLKSMDFYSQAIRRAQAFLPEGAATGTPRAAFVIFAPDGRGYDPIVFDVLYCLENEGTMLNYVAHEFHHWYRDRLVDVDQDHDAVWILNQVALEGVADLIDKAGWPERTGAPVDDYQKRYLDAFGRSPEIIRSMDAILSQMTSRARGRADLGAKLQKIVPLAGHPTGLYMARIILEELGRETLVGTVANPFAFFRQFSAAARKRGRGTPAFSDEAIAYFDLLEKRYLD